MNQKQLANVLVKILGLSFCVEGIIRAVYVIISLINTTIQSRGNSAGIQFIWADSAVSALVSVAIGVFFIIRSRWLVEKLFKNEEE
jgi:hypothetical protein